MVTEQTAKGRKIAKKNWKLNNPRKYTAENICYAATRDGKLRKQPCVICKKKFKVDIKAHAHHSDYSKPLEVQWLCPKHHKAWHRNFVAEAAI